MKVLVAVDESETAEKAFQCESSYLQKAAVAPCIGRIFVHPGVDQFSSFPVIVDFFPVKLLRVRNSDNLRKALYASNSMTRVHVEPTSRSG